MRFGSRTPCRSRRSGHGWLFHRRLPRRPQSSNRKLPYVVPGGAKSLDDLMSNPISSKRTNQEPSAHHPMKLAPAIGFAPAAGYLGGHLCRLVRAGHASVASRTKTVPASFTWARLTDFFRLGQIYCPMRHSFREPTGARGTPLDGPFPLDMGSIVTNSISRHDQPANLRSIPCPARNAAPRLRASARICLRHTCQVPSTVGATGPRTLDPGTLLPKIHRRLPAFAKPASAGEGRSAVESLSPLDMGSIVTSPNPPAHPARPRLTSPPPPGRKARPQPPAP